MKIRKKSDFMINYRFMRVIVFFDLPMETRIERRNYASFRKFLIRSGFIMMQKSIYTKLALNLTAASSMMAHVRRNKPEEGLIQMLIITENQFSRIEYVLGDKTSEILDSEERVVIL